MYLSSLLVFLQFFVFCLTANLPIRVTINDDDPDQSEVPEPGPEHQVIKKNRLRPPVPRTDTSSLLDEHQESYFKVTDRRPDPPVFCPARVDNITAHVYFPENKRSYPFDVRLQPDNAIKIANKKIDIALTSVNEKVFDSLGKTYEKHTIQPEIKVISQLLTKFFSEQLPLIYASIHDISNSVSKSSQPPLFKDFDQLNFFLYGGEVSGVPVGGLIDQVRRAIENALYSYLIEIEKSVGSAGTTIAERIEDLQRNLTESIGQGLNADALRELFFGNKTIPPRQDSYGDFFFGGIMDSLEEILSNLLKSAVTVIWSALKLVLEDIFQFVFDTLVKLLPLLDSVLDFVLKILRLASSFLEKLYVMLNEKFFITEVLIFYVGLFYYFRDFLVPLAFVLPLFFFLDLSR